MYEISGDIASLDYLSDMIGQPFIELFNNGMKKLLLDSIYFIQSHRGAIFQIVGPFFLAMSVFGAYINASEPDNSWMFTLYLTLFAFGQAFYMCRLIKYMASVVTGNEPDLSVSLNDWVRIFGVHVLYGVAVLIGIMALIIPGVYLSARYGFAEFEAALNQRSPFEAMSSSWTQTKEYTTTLMLGVIVVAGGGLVLDLLLTGSQEATYGLALVTGFLAELASAFVVVLMSVFFFRVYVSSLDFSGTASSDSEQ